MNDHPDFLRFLGNVCKPDSRSKSFVRLTENGPRPITIEDQYRSVVRLILHDGVPEGIRIQFETTKNLYLYSWFVYRFYPVAQHHAYTCLELALRERFEAEMLLAGEQKREHGPGLRRLLTYAIAKGFLKNENFEVWRHRTRVNAKMRTMYEEIEEMSRLGLDQMELDESKVEIKDVDRNHDYLTILLETIPYLRNHYAHGSKSLHNQVLGTLQVVVEIINQIFPKKELENEVSDI
ncbi:MAG: hypothetical protein WD823_02865 [Sulfuricaulis sp.]|uniref:hypothetical protein n=1 Tax=Sulfuricaulis sp. TaxID=2003553 RepID=UPI0034A4C94E